MSLFKNIKNYKSLLKNTFFVFSRNAIQKICGLVTVYILVRLFDKPQFGEYQFILSLIGLLALFALPGLQNAITQSVARGFKGTFIATLKPAVLSSLIGSVILCILGLWSFFTKTTETHMVFYVAAVLFPAVHGLKYWRAVHAGEERFSALFIIDSTATIVTTIFVVIAAFLFSNSIIWPITAVLLVPSVQNLFFTYKAIKSTEKNALIEKGSLSYGIKTTLYSSLNIIANHLDKLLIYAFFSPSALALYFVSERLSELTKTVAQDLSAVLAPRFAKTETYTQRLDKILNLMSIAIGIAILLFTFTLVPWIVTLLFGESYSEAIPYTQALLCSVAIGNHAILRNRFVNSKLDKKSNRDIAASTALIRILTSVILVPIFGIVGAIVSAFIYRISTVFVLNYIIKHRYQSREKNI